MAIYLSGETAAVKPKLDDLTPRQIVEELDKYVVGQTDAKRAVAVALRIESGGRNCPLRSHRTCCLRNIDDRFYRCR